MGISKPHIPRNRMHEEIIHGIEIVPKIIIQNSRALVRHWIERPKSYALFHSSYTIIAAECCPRVSAHRGMCRHLVHRRVDLIDIRKARGGFWLRSIISWGMKPGGGASCVVDRPQLRQWVWGKVLVRGRAYSEMPRTRALNELPLRHRRRTHSSDWDLKAQDLARGRSLESLID